MVRTLVLARPVRAPHNDRTTNLAPAAAIGVYWSRHHRATPRQIDDLQGLATRTAEAIRRIGLADAPWAPTFTNG